MFTKTTNSWNCRRRVRKRLTVGRLHFYAQEFIQTDHRIKMIPYVFLNYEVLDWSKLKAFVDDKINVLKMMISVFDRVENMLEKEKMLITSIFSSTGQRPASYCHVVVSVMHPSVRSVRLSMCACVCKLFLQKTSPQKLSTGFL